MKNFIDAIDIKKFKDYYNVQVETARISMQNQIADIQGELNRDAEKVIRGIIDKELNKLVPDMEARYDELSEAIYNLLLIIPKDERLQFIETNLQQNKEAFIAELKKYNEI